MNLNVNCPQFSLKASLSQYLIRSQDADWWEQYSWALFKAMSHMLCIGYGRFLQPYITRPDWEKDSRHQRPIQVSPTVLDGYVVDDAEHDERGHLLRHVPRPRHQPYTVP